MSDGMVAIQPCDACDTSKRLEDAGPFQDCRIISSELIATVDMIVMMSVMPSTCSIGNSMDKFFETRDWYDRPDVRAKFDEAFKMMDWGED